MIDSVIFHYKGNESGGGSTAFVGFEVRVHYERPGTKLAGRSDLVGGAAADNSLTSPGAQPMSHRDGSPSDEVTLALRRSGERWLRWLRDEVSRRGDTPRDRLLGLWDVLEEWFATEDFRVSVTARAAAALWAEPDDPVGAIVGEHRRAVRRLLEELAAAAGVHDPPVLAARLHVLLEGAVASALIDGRPGVARTARDLAAAALGEPR
jgi:hypothetical protein